MFGADTTDEPSAPNAPIGTETAANQARLEYYTDNISRKKYDSPTHSSGYWLASPHQGSSSTYLIVDFSGQPSGLVMNNPDNNGVVPAFCVQGIAPSTVTLNKQGGTGGPSSVTVAYGAAMPAASVPSKPGYVFGGYWTAVNGGGTQYYTTIMASAANWNLTGNTTLYAYWTEIELALFIEPSLTPVPGVGNLPQALEWLRTGAAGNTSYRMEFYKNVSSAPVILRPSYLHGKSDITITLVGSGGRRTIQLTGTGPLFDVGNITLNLKNNITLRGVSNNTEALIILWNGASLNMADGAEITGNANVISFHTWTSAGGVGLREGTRFVMSGGTISGNTGTAGGTGGVDIWRESSFTMSGGTISGNTGGTTGGVYAAAGMFIMNGGTISGNTGTAGGGVYANGASFTMNGGIISGNTAISTYHNGYYYSGNGGGILASGTVTMNGGTISGNTATLEGGGVCINDNTSFTMNGGTISGNTASDAGGGVFAFANSRFIMSGGAITGTNKGAFGNTLWKIGSTPVVRYGGSYGGANILQQGYTNRPLPYDNGSGGAKDPAPLN
jgi:uncharacterized repeat protein (TIGR02543 family)